MRKPRGRRIRLSMLRVLLLISALSLLPLVSSFNVAAIRSRASVVIVDSTNALVAVTANRGDGGNVFAGNTQVYAIACGTITNNVGLPLALTVNGTSPFFLSTTSSTTLQSCLMLPGDSALLHIMTASGGTYSGTVSASWSGGSAQVNFTVPIDFNVIPRSIDVFVLSDIDGFRINTASFIPANVTVDGALLTGQPVRPAGEHVTFEVDLGRGQLYTETRPNPYYVPPLPPKCPQLGVELHSVPPPEECLETKDGAAEQEVKTGSGQ